MYENLVDVFALKTIYLFDADNKLIRISFIYFKSPIDAIHHIPSPAMYAPITRHTMFEGFTAQY